MADPSIESGPNDHLVEAFSEICRQASGNEDIGPEEICRVLRTALSSLCERFSGAYTLSRPHVMWEILVHIEEELSKLYGVPIWATTSLPQPTPWDNPVSGKAHEALNKILAFSTADTLFHNVKEWCQTGRVAELGIEAPEPYAPQDPAPAEPTEAEDEKPAKPAGGQKRKQQQQQKKKPAESTRGQKRKKPTEPTKGQGKKPAQPETSPEPTEPTRCQLAAASGGRPRGLGPQPADVDRQEEDDDLQMALQLSLQEVEPTRGHGKKPAQSTTSLESTEPTRGRRTAPSGGRRTAPQLTDIDREEEDHDLQMALQLSLQEAERVASNRQPAGGPSTHRAPQQLPYAGWRPDPRQTPVPTGYGPGPAPGLVPRRSRARTPTGYTPPPERAASPPPERDASPPPDETRPAKKRRLD